jgi:D-alanyl-D-alanine carboxypeptidase/D-alanyl-D-alanine-endopeptidase (penicillin-binding protein 4)
LNSALAVNFNTINAVRDGKTVRSAEEQTPITPLAISQFLRARPERHGPHQPDAGRSERERALCRRTARRLHREAGGKRRGRDTIGPVPENLEPVYVHRQSRTLSEILRLMLIGSNNYIANQVFLEIGADLLGGPVSLDKSLRVANEILARHGLAEGDSSGGRLGHQPRQPASPRAALPTCSRSSRPMPN